MSNGAASGLISLLVVALVARRELRASTRVAGRLWLRPAVIAIVTAALAALAVFEAPGHIAVLVAWVAGGVAVGIATGIVLVRFTAIRPAARPDAVVVQGSLATIGVWVVVLVLRVGARMLFGGSSEADTIDASVGTVAVVASASATLASAFHRAIALRTGGTG
jgi:hypothetical protein